jgi:hypothetical protein
MDYNNLPPNVKKNQKIRIVIKVSENMRMNVPHFIKIKSKEPGTIPNSLPKWLIICIPF